MRAGGERRGGGQMHFEGENTISSQLSGKRLFISTDVQWCGTEKEITPTHANQSKVAQFIGKHNLQKGMQYSIVQCFFTAVNVGKNM
jgi:hypothetical protein